MPAIGVELTELGMLVSFLIDDVSDDVLTAESDMIQISTSSSGDISDPC